MDRSAEATSNLNPIGARASDRLPRTLADSLALTVVMVTHDLQGPTPACTSRERERTLRPKSDSPVRYPGCTIAVKGAWRSNECMTNRPPFAFQTTEAAPPSLAVRARQRLRP